MSSALRIFRPTNDLTPPFSSAASLSPSMTPTAFYRVWFAPAMAGRLRRQATIAQAEESLRLWAAYTGDPPMYAITPDVTAAFVVALSQRKNKLGRPISRSDSMAL